MRIHFAVIAVFCVGCSSPHQAYFQSVPTPVRDECLSKAPFQGTSLVTPIEMEQLEADASSEVVVKPYKTAVSTVRDDRTAAVNLKPDFKKKSNADPRDKVKNEGDKKKNAFALAGFGMSVAGLIILVAAFAAADVTVTALTIGFLVTAIGIVLSRMGRKSEKRVLASIGFWLGLGVMTLGAIMGLLVYIYNSIN